MRRRPPAPRACGRGAVYRLDYLMIGQPMQPRVRRSDRPAPRLRPRAGAPSCVGTAPPNKRAGPLLRRCPRPSRQIASRVALLGPTSMRKPLSRPERVDRGTSQTSNYERSFVKRGRCGFCIVSLPHIPLAVGLGRSGPSQTCPQTNGRAAHNTSPSARPREISSPALPAMYDVSADVT
jgi:hypothetical protein